MWSFQFREEELSRARIFCARGSFQERPASPAPQGPPPRALLQGGCPGLSWVSGQRLDWPLAPCGTALCPFPSWLESSQLAAPCLGPGHLPMLTPGTPVAPGSQLLPGTIPFAVVAAWTSNLAVQAPLRALSSPSPSVKWASCHTQPRGRGTRQGSLCVNCRELLARDGACSLLPVLGQEG